MCSLIDGFYGEEFLHEQKSDISNLNELMCQKCSVEKAEVRLRRKDNYCNGCFLISATHKFRATLGKSKIVRPSDTILVGHNGGAGSTALLNLIKGGMHESVHKRLVFGVKVLYIDDGLIKGQSTEERETKMRKIHEQVEALGFQAYGVSLSDAMDFDNFSVSCLKSMTCSNDEKDKRLSEMWNGLVDETSKKDFQQKLRNKVMMMAAKSLKCQKIFLANDSTSLAIKILSNVSLGRGAQLSSDCGFIDNRYADVVILRPMRDFSRRELYYYLKICNYSFIGEEKLKDNLPFSIQKLTGKFVTNLEDQFSGTVSTIFRTGEKIVVGKGNCKDNTSIEGDCVFCNGCLDTTALGDCTSSIDATNFSKIVSLRSSDAEWNLEKLMEKPRDSTVDMPEHGCEDCTCGRSRLEKNNIKYEDVRQFLCYACQSIFHGNFDLKTLPPFMINSVSERLRLKNIAAEIQDFLL
ncbi:cytoplasmic tRNA 2-thiolation protein 2 [Diachasma alloeum]|uniref:cytoplasmic tRNA 2-thiolation protein 2 n=1 Tax=Diachasma alloeum TaxID=454923 RepID=UPI000738186B|nr:cytoplasmic tRNA 2-thiolation protein 2 [Diachasma alloeum]